MNGAHLLNETAVVTDRTQQADDSGALIRDAFGNVQLHETTRSVAFWFEQDGADEAPPVAEQTGTGYLPPDDPITSLSKVTWRGLSFEVVGPPDRPFNPRTGEPGVVRVALKRTTG